MEVSVFFAPLQGLTDHEFRMTYESVFGGVKEYFTPFMRVENGVIRKSDLRELNFVQKEAKTTPQILPKNSLEAAILVEQIYAAGCRRVDINMGCPFVKVVQGVRGAGILPYPEKVADVLSITEKFPEIEFSLKMRSGLESSTDLWPLIPIINKVNLRHVTLHARTAKEGYEGEPDKKVFARFLSECSHPVVYNGNILSFQGIKKLQEDFPLLSGVMIGRGLLAHPDLLYPEWNCTERKARCIDFYERIYDAYARKFSGEMQILKHMQEFWTYFMPDADKKLKKKLKKTQSLFAFESYAQRILEEYNYV